MKPNHQTNTRIHSFNDINPSSVVFIKSQTVQDEEEHKMMKTPIRPEQKTTTYILISSICKMYKPHSGWNRWPLFLFAFPLTKMCLVFHFILFRFILLNDQSTLYLYMYCICFTYIYFEFKKPAIYLI